MSTAFSSNTAQSVGNAGLPIFSSETQASAKSPPGRSPNALDVLLITSTEGFFQDGASQLENSAKLLHVPMHTLYVENLTGYSQEEKVAALKAQLQELHRSGQIDAQTQVIIDIHGTIHDAPHHLSNKQNNFSIGTSDMVSLVREAGKGAAPSSDGSSWQGTIHINACGAGRASQDLKDGAGITLLYAGKKIKFHFDARAIFGEIIRRLGEYRKDPAANKFPTAADFFSAAGSVSGEKVHMAGNGNLVQIRSGYLPHPTELTQTAVRARLERSLLAKISHGKPANVQKAVDLLGAGLKNVGGTPPLLIALNEYTTDAEEKIGILLRAGVDINQQFASGDTALHIACRAGKKEVLALLLRQGADVSVLNAEGSSVLQLAIRANRLDLFELLIEAGANLNERTDEEDSLLHLACAVGNDRLIDRLLQKGFDLHLQNSVGDTPLLKLIEAGHTELALSLLSRKDQEGKMTDVYGEHAFRLAILARSPGLFQAFLNLSSEKSKKLNRIFERLVSEINNKLKSYNSFDVNFGENYKILFSALISELLPSFERMPKYLKEFLRTSEVAKSEFIKHIFSQPDFVARLEVDVKEIRDFYDEEGLDRACRIVDAELAKKASSTGNLVA